MFILFKIIHTKVVVILLLIYYHLQYKNEEEWKTFYIGTIFQDSKTVHLKLKYNHNKI